MVSDEIGDPQTLLRAFEQRVRKFRDMDPLLPKMREAEKVIQANPDLRYKRYQELETMGHEGELALLYDRNILSFAVHIKFHFPYLAREGLPLFRSILQKYSLPPTIRKGVEAASRSYTKTRMNTPSKEDALDAYEKMASNLSKHVEIAKQAIEKGSDRSSEGVVDDTPESERFKAGPFVVVNTGGFSAEVMAEVKSVVEKATHLLQAKGLGRVCYGDILITNTITSKANILAFYLVDKDEMFIRANLKGRLHEAVRTVIHELAHRLHFKFLKSKDIDIRRLYQQLTWSDDELIRSVVYNKEYHPKPGDTIEAKGKVYEVTGISYRGTRPIVDLVNQKDRTKKADVSLEAWLKIKGTYPKSDKGFVTQYAKKNHEENFAEMVAAYCLDQLPESQVASLEAILK